MLKNTAYVLVVGEGDGSTTSASLESLSLAEPLETFPKLKDSKGFDEAATDPNDEKAVNGLLLPLEVPVLDAWACKSSNFRQIA